MSKTQNDYNIFSNKRAQYKILSKLNYSSYIARTEKNLINNPKSFWRRIKKLKHSDGLPGLINYGNTNSNDPIKISNIFNDTYFLHTPLLNT
jgi:hypothetical protein